MKKLFASLLLCSSVIANTQTNKTDSLKLVLQHEKKDTNRVMTLMRLAVIYRYSKPDSTLLLAIQGLSISQQIGFMKGEANCFESMGDANDNLGNYPKALENYFNALKIYEKTNDVNGTRRATGDIGNIYSDLGEYRHALEYALKAAKMAEKLNNKKAMSVQFLNVGDDYNRLTLFDSAKFYTQQCYELAMHLNDTDIIGTALNNLGEIHSGMDQTSLALQYYHLGISFLQKAEDDDVQCETYLGMSKLFRKEGQSDSCQQYAYLSFTIAKNDGLTKRIYDASSFLTDYYKVNQKFDSAFAYQQITMDTKDSLFSEEKIRQIQNLSFQEKQRQQEIAEEKQRAEEERKYNLQLIGITAFIITFILFFLLIVRRKTKPRTIEFFGVMALLLVFEFTSLFIHPYIERWTNHTPVFMLLILVCVASILVPIHHKTEKLIKEKLAHKIHTIRS